MRDNFREQSAPCVGKPWMGEMMAKTACTASIVNLTIVFFNAEGEIKGRSAAVDLALIRQRPLE